MWRQVSAGVVLLLLAIGLNCSSSDEKSPADDPTNCGPGPYGKLIGTVLEATTNPPAKPKEEAKISLDLCPDKSFVTNAEGKATANVTKGKPVLITIEHNDDLPALLGEWRLDVDTFEGTAQIIPRIFQAVVAPRFGAETTIVGFGVSYPAGTFPEAGVPEGGPTDPCQRSEGVSYSLPGHPEAKINYFTTDTLPKPDASLTATTTNGLATVENLADGATITPVATKAGCKLTGVHDGFTGRATVKKGFTVLMQFQMTR